MTSLNLDTVPRRRTFELDQVVVGADCRTAVRRAPLCSKVLAFCLALERLVARLEKTGGEEGMRRSDAVRVLSSHFHGGNGV